MRKLGPVCRSVTAVAALIATAISSQLARATDVALRPINAGGLMKTNVVMAWDNSSSMDFEVLLPTAEGALWWRKAIPAVAAQAATKTAAAVAEVPRVPGTAWSGGTFADLTAAEQTVIGTVGYPYASLFPIYGTDAQGANWNTPDFFWGPVPPTKQFAALWSSEYNKMYFNPSKTYVPWPAAYMGGQLVTFANQNPTAAQALPGSADSKVFDLTRVQSPWPETKGYLMLEDQMVPKGAKVYDATSKVTTIVAAETTLKSAARVAIDYYWPTYWKKESCAVVVDDETCAYAPDQVTTLKRYQIQPGTPEMQNFANWWSYYRRRFLMANAAVGQSFSELTGVRLGILLFNTDQPDADLKIYDADSTTAADNFKGATGSIYRIPLAYTTKTHDAMLRAGERFTKQTDLIQYACQRNNMFVVTDGYANVTPTRGSPPSYGDKFSQGWPYQTTQANSLADIAMSYYTGRDATGAQFIGKNFATGKVQALGEDGQADADRNTNLHVNTFGVALGASGDIWPKVKDAYNAPASDWPGQARSWPVPALKTPSMIDDLWHATINGRGQMFRATDAFDTAGGIVEAFENMTQMAAGQAALAVDTPDLASGNGLIYAARYDGRGWGGDINAYPLDKVTGAISTTPKWTAATRLATRTDARLMAIAVPTDTGTKTVTKGMPFVASSFDATLIDPARLLTAEEVDYLRGNRSGEGTLYRKRSSLLGAVINAQPLVIDGVLYASTGEGFVHAFDAQNGNELWAFAPASVAEQLKATTRRTWPFKTLLDGSPVTAKIGDTQMLFVGRGVAGSGVMALDISGSIGTEADLAQRWKWEFPTTQGITNAGLTLGVPLAVRNSVRGEVVVIAQGYNGTANDGKARVHVLNARTGAVIGSGPIEAQAVDLGNAKMTSGDPGLAHLSGFVEPDGTVRYVYGGDEMGTVWRFDLDTLSATAIARLTDASGKGQPVTAAPELANLNVDRVVIVGTGRLMGVADFIERGASQTQSFYAFKDTGTLTTRADLVARQVEEQADGKSDLVAKSTASSSAFSWDSSRGWYFDLTQGFQAHLTPYLARGLVTLPTNAMSPTDCAGNAEVYTLDLLTASKPSDKGNVSIQLGGTVSAVNKVTTTGDKNSPAVDSSKLQSSSGGTESIDDTLPALPPARKNAWRVIHN